MKQLLRYIFVLTAMLMVAVGDMWGQTYKDGVWYSLYDLTERKKGTDTGGEIYNYTGLFTPNSGKVTFNTKMTESLGINPKDYSLNVGGKTVSVGSAQTSYIEKSASDLDANITSLKFSYNYTTAKNLTRTVYINGVKLPLAKHILLESGTFGISSVTVTDNNLATAEGQTSTNKYQVKLRSFLASGNIKMTSSNAEFHFGGGVTEIYLGVANNYCASANGSGSCTNASTLGHISSYYKDVYFSPSVQYNANARSTTITITDGVNTAYVYLTAPVIPTYYFKAEAIASPVGGGDVSATFANGQSTSSVVANSYEATSADAVVTFSMNGCAANHVFEGWKEKPEDANYLDDLQGADKTSFTRTISSSALDPRSLDSQLTYYAIFSSRFTATITGSNYVDKLVGESFPADYNFISTQTEKPSASAADPFYFVIDHNFDRNDTREGSPRPDEVIAYDPENNTITPLNEGTATITFYQKNTDSHNPVSKSFTVKVIKHTPSFALKSDPLYFNKEYPDYFTTTADSRLTITSSDTLVAKWVQGSNSQSYTLKTFSKTNTATLTAIQHENYYWQRWEGSVDIQLQNEYNHVQIDITESNYKDLIVGSYYGLTWNNGGVQVGDGGGGLNYEDKYIIIQFEGIPDSLFFNAVGTSGSISYPEYYIQQGTSKDNLSATKEGRVETRDYNAALPLDPTTRCVKICYSGNFGTVFKNVRITERKEFYASKVNTTTPIIELNFNKDANGDDKENQVNAPYSLSFDFHYANIGHDVNLSTNDPAHFTISQTSFKDLGGEQVGKRTITVTYSSPTEYTAENKELYITHELGDTIVIPLIAATVKATQTLTWQGVYAAERPVVRISEGAVSGLATASSGLQVTYRSSDERIIKVSEDSLSLIPLQVAEAVEITAVQKGNNVWNEVKETKPFRVTDKKTQLIHWPNTLSDLVIGGANVNLDAKVYIVDDITGEYTYSAERTANLQYTVEYTNVVDIEDGVLKIKSVGDTYLTVTAPGDENYAESSIREYVHVRTALAGCEDNLLHTSYTDSELEYFQMNLGAIQHGPFNIDRSIGEPDYITLQHRGVAWAASFGGTFEVYYETTSSAELQYAGSFSPTKNQTNVATIDLPREATKFYIKRLYGGTGYHYISNIKVHPAQYVETNVSEIDFGNIYVGSQVSQTFTVNYCNIKSEIYSQTSSADVQVSPSYFGECNGYGNQSITVTWTSSSVSEKEQTVTIADPVSGKSASVRIYANVFKGEQTLNWVAPSQIETCGELLLPEESNEHIALEWAVVAGQQYADFEDGMLAIKGNGTITLRASNSGSENYNAFQRDYQITIVYNPIFLGTEDSDWTNPANWNVCNLPREADKVTLQAPVVFDTLVSIGGLVVESNASIHIKSTGGLTGGVSGIVGAKEDGSSSIIDNSPAGAGFLKVNPTSVNKPARVTVNYSTEAYNSGNPRDEVWQYMGAPGKDMAMSDTEKTTIYHWDEVKGWVKQSGASLTPFVGYAFTQNKADSATFTVTATPIIPTEVQEIELTVTPTGMGGSNLFVNSFLAPIDLAKFTGNEFEGKVDETFYLFNSGSWKQWQSQGGKDHMEYGTSPGQYFALTPGSAALLDASLDQTTIPPMQGVYVIAREDSAKIKLDYAKHVYGADASNQPMRAPQRISEDFKRVRLHVNSQNSGADRMYVIQHEAGTAGYDNGYDARNMAVNGQVAIYTHELDGQMEISVSDKIDSTYIGFRAGSDSEYTLRMTSVVGEEMYLKDLVDNILIPVVDGQDYTFTATPNSVNDTRFLLLGQKGGVATDIETVQLYIHDNMVHVMQAPQNSTISIYTVGGVAVANYSIGYAPCTIDLFDLSTGVYVLRINDKAYKFVCK